MLSTCSMSKKRNENTSQSTFFYHYYVHAGGVKQHCCYIEMCHCRPWNKSLSGFISVHPMEVQIIDWCLHFWRWTCYDNFLIQIIHVYKWSSYQHQCKPHIWTHKILTIQSLQPIYIIAWYIGSDKLTLGLSYRFGACLGWLGVLCWLIWDYPSVVQACCSLLEPCLYSSPHSLFTQVTKIFTPIYCLTDLQVRKSKSTLQIKYASHFDIGYCLVILKVV